MDYRRRVLPWTIAVLFLGGAVLFAVLAQQGAGPWGGAGWAVVSVADAILGVLAVVIKLQRGSQP